MELFTSWNLGGQSRPDFYFMLLGSVLLLLVCLVRAGIASRNPERPRAYELRIAICPVLLVGGFVLAAADVPMRARFEMSESELDAYARSLQHLPAGSYCNSETFEKRRVGWFTVRCADRPAAGIVSLELEDDPLSPSGAWFLVRRENQGRDIQNTLSDHWSLGLED